MSGSVSRDHRRSRQAVAPKRGPADRRTAKAAESSSAAAAQPLPPAAASSTLASSCPPKSHIEWRGRAVLIRSGQYRLTLSETRGALFRQDADGLLVRADSLVCEADQQSILDAVRECVEQPLRPGRSKTVATLRRLLRAGVFGTSSIRPLPNRRMCPSPCADAPCDGCIGCIRTDFRFPVDETATPGHAPHRLSGDAK